MRRNGAGLLHIPFHGKGWIAEEGAVACSVVNEVIGQLPFRANAKVLIHIEPELRFGQYHQLAMPIGGLASPKVDEAFESTLPMSESRTPDPSQLKTVISRSVLIAFEVALVQQLHGVGF